MKIFSLVTVMLFSAMLLFTGCKKEAEKPEVPAEQPKVEQLKTPEPVEEKEPEIRIPDLTGTWTGSMSQRATTLKITEQKENEFSGNISMKFRDPINLTVEGTIDPVTLELKMKDTKKHRYQGSYKGKLSEDLETMTGTWTIAADGQTFNFTLKKKQ